MEAGLNASLELQCRKTMEIRTKHVRAGFAAGLEGLKAMEIGAKQYDKEGALFWTSKRKKKQARKNGPPQFKIPGLRGSPLPGRSQARPGEAWARPRHKRINDIATLTKRGQKDSKLYKLLKSQSELEVVGGAALA